MCIGIAGGYRAPKEEKFSLVKRKTNNDMINEMSVEDKAAFFDKITKCCWAADCDDCPLKTIRPLCDAESIKQWLESEAEE